MKQLKLLLIGTLSLVAVTSALGQRQAVPSECRKEIWNLCRDAGGGGIRQCVVRSLPKLSDSCRTAVGMRGTETPAGAREYAYGPDLAQRLDLVVPAGGKKPLLLFIHGGGWSIGDKRHAAALKADHFTKMGWAFGSINYRLVPTATVEQQAADIASAVAYLRSRATGLGLDPNRIVLIGHSAGAHLAGLVGTDPSYFATAGVPMSAVKGVILLDGAGYDIVKQMALPSNPVAEMYAAAFGRDPARQRRLSPTLHAAAPNAGRWLILPVASRADSVAQSNELAARLKVAGTAAVVTPVPNSSHAKLNRGLGRNGDFATAAVDRFLDGLR